ncbi:MAG: polysaccharide biosynthesis/export family protein [Flavobacteriales bacterium]|nr:polysaccharide biosynthesis/export family protein [Flavobacteriales bacterium]MCX7648955.1 polysaccharide biosynthesis/export family protein [Flavobacteriales bacterium]MDW8432578.1 polysaccharide biosynthesis/export family protein [Flavobacteriales bacterium]
MREPDDQLLKKEASYSYFLKEYKIQPQDILDLTFNEKDENIKQLLDVERANNNYFNTPSGFYARGYRVNQDSTIDVFNIGKIKVGGFSVEEAQNIIKQKVKEKFPYAEVNVKFVSFKVSVLGEVNNPGLHFIFNEKVSLLDALAQAGGTSEYANAQRIKIIRRIGHENRVIKIDLTREDVLSADHTVVWPHDVIYVEQLKSKPINTTFRQITPILSVISVLATVVNITALIIYRNR